MIETTDAPYNTGNKQFFAKYLGLAREKFEKYYPGQWTFTLRLEELGKKIAKRELNDDVSLFIFLIEVAVWKEPHETKAKDMIQMVCMNSYAEIKSAFDNVLKAVEVGDDFEAINRASSLQGFGRSSGSTKIASAILRFLDPERYAVVDYRNWVILSNTEGKYFPEPLIKGIANSINETRRRSITAIMYMEYLDVIRKLSVENKITPADVDMALFSFSDKVIPLSGGLPNTGVHNKTVIQRKDTRLSRPSSNDEIKRLKMVELVTTVVVDNKRKGRGKLANQLEISLRGCKTHHAIWNMCNNMVRIKSTVDSYLLMSGCMTLRHIMPALEKIYFD